MYKINKIKDDKKFKREFEGMGEGLVLLKVESMIRNTGYNYHLFYRNSKKPPLDIAINPQNHVVEYVSFFLQDEHIEQVQTNVNIELREESLYFNFEELSVDNTALNFQKDFVVQLYEKNLVVIENGYCGKIYGYLLSGNNYILVDNEDNIIGLNFKNISIQELEILKEVKVI